MTDVQLTFLAHSGFAAETKTKVLVFDYYKDPAGAVRSYAGGKKPLWFFVSHWHEDHFNPAIAGFERSTAHYIFNAEVPFHGPAAKKMQSMNIYDTIHIEDTTITQYGSTDAGGSFLVETDGCTIFHAGDLNWWHWLGDTDENNAEAKANFDREMKKLAGLDVDVAFFPVDARLEEAREWGVKRFLDVVQVRRLLVPMHYFGTPWIPSQAFMDTYGQVPLWIPIQKGDTTVIHV
ncbi:hypothetical protein AB840_07580 [Megasphaera cerevisiae DSM 20462]|jgi:L-ascorbate metabolism protein UlaG (beta-lactamase superfamily)|uniref:Hydrolase n=1 Tax=Megasphaera cerevisiae DSM 20462 TaxID=1122219 RepID=A0A0J6WWJ4_9FIRM|nr:MBL fold metallo-hydrolase [Megasphaera cerevisiae]KMO86568.1 hypothetical protein AB840_07580 [Megasphaera cerevisiae DSM 20462]OKY53742.1 hypothetical protein BSR42_05745 [Megasphaera cerevisiae]SJZ90486.1 L-ascorbate metabolism protein UlaG, beta-lactamase superfamily [Megasphaera cerevisiae DSM 20462]